MHLYEAAQLPLNLHWKLRIFSFVRSISTYFDHKEDTRLSNVVKTAYREKENKTARGGGIQAPATRVSAKLDAYLPSRARGNIPMYDLNFPPRI